MANRFALYLLLIIAVLFHHRARADEDMSNACKRAGGSMPESVCTCEDSKPLIDPFHNRCLSTQVTNLGDLVKAVQAPVCAPDSGPKNILPYPKVDFCANPAKFICAQENNPSVKGSIRSERLFNDAAEKIFKANNGMGNCRNLKGDELKKCAATLETAFASEVYTDLRKQKAKEQFERAKKAILALLDQQTSSPLLEKMKARINDTSLAFGAANDTQISTYNAFHKDNKIYVQGMITEMDINPENFYATFLHELSHGLAPVGDLRSPSYAGNPFQKSLECLKSPTSVHAKVADVACYDRLAEKFISTSAAKNLSKIAEAVRNNPDSAFGNFGQNPANWCQQGQVEEAFADWAAIEAFVLENKKMLSNIAPEPDAKMVHVSARLMANPKLAALLVDNCEAMFASQSEVQLTPENLDGHPEEEDRLNALFLAHPVIRNAIGCGDTDGKSAAPKMPIYCSSK